MLSDLTKILDRNYVVGYFLPALIFITAIFLLLVLFFPEAAYQMAEVIQQSEVNNSIEIGINSGLNFIMISKLLKDFWAFSLVIVVIFSLSILLMVLNRSFIRFLEGYGLLQKLRLQKVQQWKFNCANRNIEELDKKYLDELDTFGRPSQETVGKRMREIYSLRLKFPKEKNEILPTGFGNAMRAFEVYSRVRYGIDSIPAWPRIISVVPDDRKDTLNASKAQVDFAVNIVYLSSLTLIIYLYFTYYKGVLYMTPIPIMLLIIIKLTYSSAISSAIAWGENVKAIFDLYRLDLLTKMGFEIPGNLKSERECWQEINCSFLYWDDLDEIKAKRLGKKVKIKKIYRVEHETTSYVDIEY